MPYANIRSHAPTIVEFRDDESPDFEVSRDDESGDVTLKIETSSGDQIRINIGRFWDSADALATGLEGAAKDVRSHILDGWQDTPEDEDGWVSEGRDGYYVKLGGSQVGDGFASKDIAVYELAEAMATQGYFPNAWCQNERGNTDNIADQIRAFHDAGGDKMLPLEGVEYEEGDRVYQAGGDWPMTVDKDYGQLGIVMHTWGDPTISEHVTDRSEVTRYYSCQHCGKRLVRDVQGSTDVWYAANPDPGTAPGFCDESDDGAHEAEDD